MHPLLAFGLLVGLIFVSIVVAVINDRERETRRRMTLLEEQAESHEWRLQALEPEDEENGAA